jgi:hypothetical protein
VLVVTLFQVGQVFAGHLAAFMAEPDLVLEEFLAAAFYVAVFCSRSAASAVGYFAFLLGDAVGKREVPFADVTVNSARHDEFGFETLRFHKM